jgi:hypothetical protein
MMCGWSGERLSGDEAEENSPTRANLFGSASYLPLAPPVMDAAYYLRRCRSISSSSRPASHPRGPKPHVLSRAGATVGLFQPHPGPAAVVID